VSVLPFQVPVVQLEQVPAPPVSNQVPLEQLSHRLVLESQVAPAGQTEHVLVLAM